MKKFGFIALVLCLALVGCDDQEERSERIQKARAMKCSDHVYVKVGGEVFKILREKINHMKRNGASVSADCNTTVTDPLSVEYVSFTELIQLHDPEISPYRIQFRIEKYPTDKKDLYKSYMQSFKEEDKKIESLPKEGEFYKYIYNKTYKAAHYISANNVLIDYDNNPIVLTGCKPQISALKCNLGFRWKEGVYVGIREIGNRNEGLPKLHSMDVWLQVFSNYQKNLENLIVKHEGKLP